MLFAFSQITITALAQREVNSDRLILRGTVLNIKPLPLSDNSDWVTFEVDLDIKFTNKSDEPVIFLLPRNEPQAEIFRLEVISLALSKLQAERYPYELDIYRQGMYTSIFTNPEYKEMAVRLDQPSPPKDLTKTLNPKESWTWQTKCEIRFSPQTKTRSEDSDLTLSFYGRKRIDDKRMSETVPLNAEMPMTELGWDVIGKVQTSLWMRLSYQVWSNNLQRADNSLRFRLQRRWKNVGYLVTADELNTQAIELKLYEAATSGVK
ncbi:MAG TPA: hypothetical protein VK400_17885 [Pyrinomonadaceae bacterium]|nr:hypothetical protein [Pyrinomonadaceae bacterium]